MTKLNNIVNTTLFLRLKRTAPFTTDERRKKAFERWVASLKPKHYVLYRINSVHGLTANTHVQTKLYLMPCLKFDGDAKLYPMFDVPFEFFATVEQIRECDDGWISVYAQTGHFAKQTITVTLPGNHPSLLLEEAMYEIALPDDWQSKLIPNPRFCHFHFFYREADIYEKSYGVIDRMQDRYHHDMTPELPPGLDFPDEKPVPPPTPQLHCAPAAFSHIPGIEAALAGDFDSFFKANRPNVPPKKR